MTTILYVLIAILLLGILIAVHEWGHFIVARMTGIQVQEFALGFGPKLLGWVGKKSGTKFSLRLIPMGGYCAFYGEDNAEGKTLDDPRAYSRQKVWKRMLSVLMGPGMNFILAFVVLVAFFTLVGAQVPTSAQPFISAVESGTPADQAGLQSGDQIALVNGVNVLDGTTQTLLDALGAYQEGDPPMELEILRGEETVKTQLIPMFDAAESRYRLGVSISANYTFANQRLSLGEAITASWDNCIYAGSMIFNALKDLVTTGAGLDQTAGPVGVVSSITTQVQQGGFNAFINLLVMISINLGIMNLLPIPGLDGSRFLFMLLEAIRRKPIPPQREAMVHLAGYVLLFGIMIFFTFKDVLRLIS